MRDINNNNFRNIIKEISEDIIDTKTRINRVSIKNRKESLKLLLVTDLLEKTIAHYSVGDDKETVKKSLLETIEAFEEGFNFKGFNASYGAMDTMSWIVSLAILCDVELDDFKKVTSVIKRDNAQDYLLNTLIKSKQIEWDSSYINFIQKHPYASTNKINNASDIKWYLDKIWYKGQSDSYWHNSHIDNKDELYFGYWAWEVAALVKVKGIDDSSLKDQKYYPYDAVHW